MTIFIYHPRSGDRVFAARPTQEIRIVTWANSCRHVLGGVHLSWQTAIPNAYWRGEAKTIARAIVEGVGGIAWDEQGAVSLIVPARVAWRANELMCAAGAPVGAAVRLENEVALIAAGAASLNEDLLPVYCAPPALVPVRGIATYKDEKPVSIEGGEQEEVQS